MQRMREANLSYKAIITISRTKLFGLIAEFKENVRCFEKIKGLLREVR